MGINKRYFIKTYGCQMNKNDSEIIAGILEQSGFVKTENVDQADIIITNTCSVRDSAERKVKGFLGDISKLKKQNKELIIGVIGCMAERLGEELLKKYDFIDFVLGPNKEQELENILLNFNKVKSLNNKFVLTGDSTVFRNSFISKREKSVNAWITIMEGCDNFCSYCIVPYVRGREKSRSVADIIKEIELLDKNIFKEITLLGQNVNSYKYGLANLLKETTKVDGIHRIRFMTSHPRDMSDGIIDVVAKEEKVCEFFHLPMQSGDDTILKKMNRGYDSAYYLELVKKIRSKIPEAAIASDFIVGFPGETEEQFENTLKMIELIEFDSANTLAFNPRPKTLAAQMPDQLPRNIIKQRLYKLIEVVERVTMKKNAKLVGTLQEILIENDGIGRTRTNKIVKFKSNKYKVGDIVFAKILSAKSWVLQGEIVG